MRALLDLSVLGSTSRRRGIGRYAADLARGLARIASDSGEEIMALERAYWTRPADISADLDGVLGRQLASTNPLHSHPRWANRQRYLLAGACRQAQVDCVHTTHPEATPWRLPCRRVTTCHDLVPLNYADRYVSWYQGSRFGRKRRDHRRYHSADHVIAISRTTADDLVRLLQLPARRISIVPNGVDLSRWQRPDDREHLPSEVAEQPFVLYVGAGDWRKNYEGMFRSLALARARPGGRELMLVCAGGLHPKRRQELLRLAEELGVATAVVFIGFAEDDTLLALYRAAVCTMLISRLEGFGYPVVEAMAASSPVITSHSSSTAEIARGAAILVEPEDHLATAEAMCILSVDTAERRRLIAAGEERAKDYTIERMAKGTLEAYRSAMAY